MIKKAVLLLLLAAAGIAVWAFLVNGVKQAEAPPKVQDAAPAIAHNLSALWSGTQPSEAWQAQAQAIYLAARRQGRRLAHVWVYEPSIAAAVQQLKLALDDERDAQSVDVLELVLARDFKNLNPRDRGWSTNIHRGVHGFEIAHEDIIERYAPTYMLSTNRDTRRLIKLFQVQHGLSDQQMLEQVSYRSFQAEQWLIRLGTEPRAQAMERGNTFVPVESVNQDSTKKLAALATQWMQTNLQDNGRMTYKYWPSARQESTSNNMIRQWMATIALIRAAKHWQDDALMQRAANNIDYNLQQFYHEENGHGLIEFRGKIKLGAVALAALALVEHPQSQRWAKQEAALRRTTDYLWNDNGMFTTFYKPKGRNDIQNFYPGEALLYWAFLYERDREPERLKRILASFKYYRDWHLNPANRNPAFIPWHTQAYYKIWQITGNEELKDFIFKTNDWLVDVMQQWEGDVLYRDTLGRFYSASRPYGPPHVSSTGVYMEGLIDAFELAKAESDVERAERYRKSIIRGLRSVMQLQFDSDLDMFYVPKALHPRVYGGMRTTVYNNEIRCDNVQHNLMAVLKILQGFQPQDYAHNGKPQTPEQAK
ncbi:MAG: hypothetical protein ACPHER_08885 [Nevskiales bacterium]